MEQLAQLAVQALVGLLGFVVRNWAPLLFFIALLVVLKIAWIAWKILKAIIVVSIASVVILFICGVIKLPG